MAGPISKQRRFNNRIGPNRQQQQAEEERRLYKEGVAICIGLFILVAAAVMVLVWFLVLSDIVLGSTEDVTGARPTFITNTTSTSDRITLETPISDAPITIGTTTTLTSTEDGTTTSDSADTPETITSQSPITDAPTTIDTSTVVISTEGGTNASNVIACSSALGLENNQLPDSRITSELDKDGTPNRAFDGRLNSNSYWDAEQTSSSWIQVYLGITSTVGGLVTQGHDMNWVANYYVQFQRFGEKLRYLDSKRLFSGNVDGSGSVTNTFESPIETILIRLEPNVCNGKCQLRLEILGCSSSVDLSKACMIPSGIEHVTGVPDRHNIEHPSGNGAWGRLNEKSPWAPTMPLADELIQVRLADQMFIAGVILQCRPHHDDSNAKCVTSMLIKHGNDIGSMQYINNVDTGMPRIFHVSHQTEYAYAIISFETVLSETYIQIQPLTSSFATGALIIMRFEILTCHDSSGTLTLPDSEPKPFSIVVPGGGYRVGEGEGNIDITIERTCLPDCTDSGIVVLNTADYTATAGLDYTPIQDEPVNFSTDASDTTVGLRVNKDTAVEQDESLIVYLEIQVNGEMFHQSFAYITITSDDV